MHRAPMPEASVHKNGDSDPKKDKIWPGSVQSLAEAVANPPSPEFAPEKQFRKCISTSDRSHIFAALFARDTVPAHCTSFLLDSVYLR